MICRTVAMIALVASATGCTGAAPISTPASQSSAVPRAAPPARTAAESTLDCHLVSNEGYSAARGSTEQDAVASLTGWYPLITTTTRWDGPPSGIGAMLGSENLTATDEPASTATEGRAGTAPSTWLLFSADGRGYGTATANQPDPAVTAWTATVDALCIAVVPPGPAEYADLMPDGRTAGESLQDRRNAGFRASMDDSILGLPEGEAADALRAVGWRVRVSERDGVPQFQAGASSSWINLAIADHTVVGYGVG